LKSPQNHDKKEWKHTRACQKSDNFAPRSDIAHQKSDNLQQRSQFWISLGFCTPKKRRLYSHAHNISPRLDFAHQKAKLLQPRTQISGAYNKIPH